jgi:hypothetical protein
MKAIAVEILGLFVDDQGLALAVLGCLGALVVSTLKGAKR